jgi:hypothetical protein
VRLGGKAAEYEVYRQDDFRPELLREYLEHAARIDRSGPEIECDTGERVPTLCFWRRFVDPPWDYDLEGEVLTVMPEFQPHWKIDLRSGDPLT